MGKIINVSLKKRVATIVRDREGVMIFSLDMYDTGKLNSGGVGRIGGEHPTHAFFPPGLPLSLGYACLLIW